MMQQAEKMRGRVVELPFMAGDPSGSMANQVGLRPGLDLE